MKLSQRNISILSGELCPYCGKTSELIDSDYIYGKSYGLVWICKPCDAYVGVHNGTELALGRLANKQLRGWKKKAHTSFDKIWQDGIMKRGKAYEWLSGELNIDPEFTHIGMFGIETCKKVAKVSNEFIDQLK